MQDECNRLTGCSGFKYMRTSKQQAKDEEGVDKKDMDEQ